jgi:hypothetical protein
LSEGGCFCLGSAGLELANVTTLSNRKIFDEEGEYGEFRYFAQESNPGRTWKDLKWVE